MRGRSFRPAHPAPPVTHHPASRPMTDDPTPPAATEPPWAFLARLEEQIAHDQEACLRDCAAPWGELLERFVDALTGRQHPDPDATDAAKGDAGGGERAGEPEGPGAPEGRGGPDGPDGTGEPHGQEDPGAPDVHGGPDGPDPTDGWDSADGAGTPGGPEAPNGANEPHRPQDPDAQDGRGGPDGPDSANGTGAPHGPKTPNGTAEPHGQEDPGAPD
ncbi:DUF6269 family protein [Streptomyces malaysiensis]|uniref:DUF6269 family protein n=1 Tax=Streptomyces malaysiensis TaxID=92644 RepID=UPI003B594051